MYLIFHITHGEAKNTHTHNNRKKEKHLKEIISNSPYQTTKQEKINK